MWLLTLAKDMMYSKLKTAGLSLQDTNPGRRPKIHGTHVVPRSTWRITKKSSRVKQPLYVARLLYHRTLM